MSIGIECVNWTTPIRFEIRIRIVAAYSIRDSIQMEISDSQVPRKDVFSRSWVVNLNKCTKLQFVHILTAESNMPRMAKLMIGDIA